MLRRSILSRITPRLESCDIQGLCFAGETFGAFSVIGCWRDMAR